MRTNQALESVVKDLFKGQMRLKQSPEVEEKNEQGSSSCIVKEVISQKNQAFSLHCESRHCFADSC